MKGEIKMFKNNKEEKNKHPEPFFINNPNNFTVEEVSQKIKDKIEFFSKQSKFRKIMKNFDFVSVEANMIHIKFITWLGNEIEVDIVFTRTDCRGSVKMTKYFHPKRLFSLFIKKELRKIFLEA